MSTEESVDPAADAPSTEPVDPTADDAADEAPATERPSWWHRDHPVFTSLVGFFTGLLFFILVPGIYGAVLNAMVDYDTAEQLFPFVLVALAVPLGLVIAPRTRRFGRYMALGVVSTAVVVLGVGALVLWYLVTYQS
ncbi:unannotated protein [freshwater metagenome]|uniref:Unannotated protein n=1 Tax=freshwater metagenome TaxID=449393 RepID=A0A6J6Q8A9_9ZZZZ